MDWSEFDFDVPLDQDFETKIKNSNMKNMTAADMIYINMEMEKKAEIIYERLSKIVKDIPMKDLLFNLAGEERGHFNDLKFRLLEMGKSMSDKKLDKASAALAVYATDELYDRVKLKEKLSRIRDLESIYEFAISMELDHILFYQATRELIKEEDKWVIDQLIDQERYHFLKLMKMRQGQNT